MATRRSRIKAVANLPARRSRPTPSVDLKKEECESPKTINESSLLTQDESVPSSEEVQPVAKGSSENTQSNVPQPSTVVSSLTVPDRKSVIVTVIEKDRKSVIVNRDDGITNAEKSSHKPIPTESGSERKSSELDTPQSSQETIANKPDDSQSIKEPSEGNSDGSVSLQESSRSKHDVSHCSQGTAGDVDCAPLKSSLSEDHTGVSSISSGVSNTKRSSVGGRRPKPTVNLVAATRKRTANDISAASPCSPPPTKIRSSDLLQRRVSESENDHRTVPAGKTSEVCPQTESVDLIEQTPLNSSDQTSLPVPTKAPPAIPTSSEPSCKVPPVTSAPSSVTVSSGTTCDDPASSTSNDNSSPHKESITARRKQSVSAQRVAAARKSLKNRCDSDGPPPRSALTMFDLIFYNPSKNPMKSSSSSSNKPRQKLTSVSSVSSIHEDRLNEESVDDIQEDKTTEDSTETAMPVPRVKVGPDGSLILDEQSLVIETTGAKKNREELERSEIVVDTGTSYGHYKKTIRSKDWSDHETKKFYRALNVVGTDFSLMKPYFRNRSRKELKLKFKKEERMFPNLVNKALAQHVDFDITELEKECALEDEEAKRQEELAKEKEKEKPDVTVKEKVKERTVKKKRVKRSLLLAEMEVELENNSLEPKTSRGIVKKTKQAANAEADYNNLAQGVVEDVPKKKKKPGNKKADDCDGESRPVKRVRKKPLTSEQSESNPSEPKPVKRVRKTQMASQASADNTIVSMPIQEMKKKTSTSQTNEGDADGSKPVKRSRQKMSASQSVSIFQDLPSPSEASSSSMNTQHTPSSSVPEPQQESVLSTSASTSRLISSPSIKIVRSTVPPSQIRTALSSPQMTPTSVKIVTSATPSSQIRTVHVTPQISSPMSDFGITTPVSRLLPSTPSLPRMEPGSIIVLKTPLPQDPERHVLQVYMVTNTPPGSNSCSVSRTGNVSGISLIQAPSLQPLTPRSTVSSEESDSEKVLTKL